jgi:hypothetical protein
MFAALVPRVSQRRGYGWLGATARRADDYEEE